MAKKQSVKQPIRLLVVRLADLTNQRNNLSAIGIAYNFDTAVANYDKEIAEYKRAIMILKGKHRA